jgi:zinc transport system substrate-binding protein
MDKTMKKLFLILSFFIFCVSCSSFFSSKKETHTTILTTISPYNTFLKKIVGDTLIVECLIPPGVSPHNFEPTFKQIAKIPECKVWFCIGEPFEKKIESVLKERNPDFLAIDLTDNLNLLYTSDDVHDPDRKDIHLWLSPKRLALQVEKMSQKLIELFPEHQQLFEKNTSEILQELKRLDLNLSTILEPLKGKSILVSHPSFSYFCLDYQLNQISTEQDGKSFLTQKLQNTYQEAIDHQVKLAISQSQYNNHALTAIANKLKISPWNFDTFSEDYYDNLLKLASTLAQAEKKYVP